MAVTGKVLASLASQSGPLGKIPDCLKLLVEGTSGLIPVVSDFYTQVHICLSYIHSHTKEELPFKLVEFRVGNKPQGTILKAR